eukprot:UN17877
MVLSRISNSQPLDLESSSKRSSTISNGQEQSP